MPELINEYTGLVDSMINTELENMRLLVGTSKKKKKGKKKSKKKKKTKKTKLNLPGYRYLKSHDREVLLTELINVNLAKRIPECRLSEFVGEFNYIHSMLDDIKDTPYDPSMALIRQLVTEYIIFPLGSELVRNRVSENIRSFLFYGPTGTGKTMIVQSCLTETNSFLVDLSPNNIDGKYPAKKEEDIMIATVMVTAKEF